MQQQRWRRNNLRPRDRFVRELTIDLKGHLLTVEQNAESASALWDASVALASHLLSLPPDTFNDKTIVEIGAGCGLPGIALAKYRETAGVVLSELSEELQLVQANVKLNELTSKVDIVDYYWGTDVTSWIKTKPDYILAADVVYEIQHFDVLVQAFVDLCTVSNSTDDPARRTTIIMAMEHRWKDVEAEFWTRMENAGFVASVVSRETLDPIYVPDAVDLYYIRKSHEVTTSV
ncbi:hypothetical protein M427DRAFT_53769 [Gonapodya prolifera JEL478]|uniref:S-adenosyl-L-methionine-dependent methyltransferase n=1 Tax=Gonapodya prolifera (strain JEL478) TaxID=1344416 RepID=A0A139ANP5_GONPJ|nr:hypothetical protein M427DRAFT_53769 [Gonapodya prolifera JEL478]|eukprot:KXS18377.1 hypothetical protein M427DRAFT_53769 [Gonapodya prolifera JEL478]